MSEQDHVPDRDPSSGKRVARKRRGLWWKIPVVLLVLLLILVLLAPTIASTSPVRSFALSRINQSMPGKLEVADWSVGWFSGTKARGISYTDGTGHKLLDVSAVTTPVTLMQLVRGNLHAGEIVIPEATLDAVVPATAEEQGNQNANPAPPSPKAQKDNRPEGTTFKMPDTSATVKIEHLGGRVTFLGKNGKSTTITLDKSSTLQAVLPPGGGPAKVDANLIVVQPGAPAPGTVTVSAVVNGLKPGVVDYTQLTGQAQVKINALDLDQVAGIARARGTDLAVKGLLSGQINVDSPRPMEGTAKGELAATDVTTTLGKDQIATKQLRIPIDVAMAGQGDAARLAINQLGVLLDQAKVNVTGDLPVKGLQQFSNGEEITQEGTAKVVAEVPDLAAVMNSLPNTVRLQQGVQVQAGRLDLQTNATLGKGGLQVQPLLSLLDVAAVRDGKKIGPLQPLTVNAAVTVPHAKAGAGDLRDLAVNIASSFLTLDAKGSSIYSTNARGEGDLARMRDDLGSIVDLSMIRGGHMTLNVVNRQPEQGVLESNINVQLTGVGLDLPATQASAATGPSAGVAVAPPRRLENANVLISARALLKDNVLTMNEPARIEMNGRLLETPKGQAARLLVDQAATLSMTGSYQTQEKKLHLTGLNVTAGKGQPVAQVSLPEGSTADLTMSGTRGVSGAAKLAVRADLGALQDIAQQYSGTAAATQPAAGGLKSGIFMGNVAVEITPEGQLNSAITDSSLDFDYVVGTTEYRDRVGINATADVSGDNSKINAALDAKGKTVNLATKAQLAMTAEPGKPQELKTIRVDQLDGKTDFAEVSLVQPVVISNVQALKDAFAGKEVPAGVEIGGALRIRGDVAKLMALGGKPGAYAINGILTATPKIALVKNAIVADFDSQVESLKVSQGNKTVVQDPKLTAGGRVSVDPKAKLLDLSNLAVNSSSGILDLKANLRVSDYGKTNKLENGAIDLTPDLGMVWPIVYAMMPPEKQAKIGEMVISGKKTSHITVAGSFPTDRPYGEAIKLVNVAGDFAIESLDWKKYGVTLAGVIPFTLKDGVVHFVYADSKATEPLVCNQGTVDLSKASIDMTGAEPRLSIEAKSQVASKLQLNSVVASSLGSYVAPVFKGVTGRVEGTLDVICDRCDRLPLGELMFSSAPANDGVAQFSVAVHGLGLQSGMLGTLLGMLGGGHGDSQLAGDLKGNVAIEKGRCLQDVVLPLSETVRLPLKGDLRLADNYYNSLTLSLPREAAAPLLSHAAGLKLAPDDLPPTIGLTFAGPVGALKLHTDVKQIVASVTQQQLQKRVLGGLLGGQAAQGSQPQAGQQGQAQPAASPQTGEQPKKPDAAETVQGLMDLFGKKKK